MAKKRKKVGKSEVQKSEKLKDKRWFFGKYKAFLKSFILMVKMKIADTCFNCQNKISYIKNLMHI